MNSKKASSEMWWIIATAVIVLVVVVIVLVFFKGGASRIFNTVDNNIDNLADGDKDGATVFDQCVCDAGESNGCPENIDETQLKAMKSKTKNDCKSLYLS